MPEIWAKSSKRDHIGGTGKNASWSKISVGLYPSPEVSKLWHVFHKWHGWLLCLTQIEKEQAAQWQPRQKTESRDQAESAEIRQRAQDRKQKVE